MEEPLAEVLTLSVKGTLLVRLSNGAREAADDSWVLGEKIWDLSGVEVFSSSLASRQDGEKGSKCFNKLLKLNFNVSFDSDPLGDADKWPELDILAEIVK